MALKIKTMSWFSRTEDYSLEDNGFYGEPEITFGPTTDDSDSGSSSTSGAWDDYQHEREYMFSCNNDRSRWSSIWWLWNTRRKNAVQLIATVIWIVTIVSVKVHTNVRKVAIIQDAGDGSLLVIVAMILSADIWILKGIVTTISIKLNQWLSDT